MKPQVAIVTGASKGVGRAITRRLAQEQVVVIAAARNQPSLLALAEEFPDWIKPFRCDVTQSEQVQSLIRFALEEQGQLDFLINNAGIGRFGPIEQLSETDWDEMLAVNLTGPFLTTKYAVPHLKKSRGHIVNISSIVGLEGSPNRAGYSASKFGLMGLGESLTKELKPYEVRVTSICPASIKTDFHNYKPYALEPEQIADAVWMAISAPKSVIYGQIHIRPQVPPKYQ